MTISPVFGVVKFAPLGATRTKNSVVETYVSDAADKLTSMSDTAGFARTFAYDGAARMTSDVRTGNFGATLVDSRVYTWNKGGRMTTTLLR